MGQTCTSEDFLVYRIYYPLVSMLNPSCWRMQRSKSFSSRAQPCSHLQEAICPQKEQQVILALARNLEVCLMSKWVWRYFLDYNIRRETPSYLLFHSSIALGTISLSGPQMDSILVPRQVVFTLKSLHQICLDTLVLILLKQSV